MRLSRSLAFWLTGTAAAVLGLHGWMQVRQEGRDLYEAATAEVTLLSTAIRTGVENAMRDEQQLDVRDLLDQLELKNPAVDVFVFDVEARLLAGSWGSEAVQPWAGALVRANPASDSLRVELDPKGAGLVAVAPIRVRGAIVGQLVVIPPTDALVRDLETERRAVMLSLALLMVTMSLVLWLVVHRRVHQPMSHLIAGIHRVSSGDLSARIRLDGRDELAEIAREFDTMADALETSRGQLISEAERRDQLERDMQRANKLAIVGQLAAMLAHEIGSPLQVLNGRARVLAARADLPPDARQSAEIIVAQTERVDRIIQRLLGVARRNTTSVADMAVEEPVRLVTELLAGEARRRGVRIELEVSPDVPSIRADIDQVQQVMLNLLQNALRASSRDGVVRVVVARSAFTRATGPEQQPSVAVSVEDTGPGVPEHQREQIFEPFFSAWQGGNGSSGTGLGLSVVTSIVIGHGGVVKVGSALRNQGARFTVHFPVNAAAMAPAGTEAS